MTAVEQYLDHLTSAGQLGVALLGLVLVALALAVVARGLRS